MRKAFIIILIILFFGAVVIFTRDRSDSFVPYTGPVEKITIGNVGEYSIFNLIAKENGYFAQNGLDAEIIEYASGPPAVQALLAGEVDFAIAADFVGVRNIFTNPDVRIISQASKQKVFHMIARKDKGIYDPTDLKGKTIGVTRKGAGEFYLGRFLLFNGLQLSDVLIEDLTPEEMNTRITNGTVDAIVLFDPHAYNLKKKLGDSVSSWSAQGEQNVFALVYSTNTYLTAHPETAVRFMRSLIQAEKFKQEHPTEVKDFLRQKLHYSQEYVDYLWDNFIFTHSLDQELLLTMEDQARWTRENNLTEQTDMPNYLEYVYFDALEKVKPAAITIIR